MKIGYQNFWVDVPVQEGLNKIKMWFANIKPTFEAKIKREYKIGLVLEETGLVYQKGRARLSLEDLKDIQIISSNPFARPLLPEIFGKALVECEDEKGWDEEDDDDCDFYLVI